MAELEKSQELKEEELNEVSGGVKRLNVKIGKPLRKGKTVGDKGAKGVYADKGAKGVHADKGAKGVHADKGAKGLHADKGAKHLD